MSVRSMAVGLVFLSAVPFTLNAQDPFRPGQWAVQFSGGIGASLGALKFRSPTKASVYDFHLNANHNESIASDSSVTVISNANVSMTLGRRTYHPVGDRVVAFHTVAAGIAFNHTNQSNPIFGSLRQNEVVAGPVFEIGGTYLVTPHLGIGATGRGFVAYGRSWGKGNGLSGAKNKGWEFSAGTNIGFIGTIFF